MSIKSMATQVSTCDRLAANAYMHHILAVAVKMLPRQGGIWVSNYEGASSATVNLAASRLPAHAHAHVYFPVHTHKYMCLYYFPLSH